MKKIKKILAAIMTLAMVLGMSMTTFAAPAPVNDIKTTINVSGLSDGVNTDLELYQIASLQYDSVTNEYSWHIKDWAAPYIEYVEATNEFRVKDGQEEALATAARNPEVNRDGIYGSEVVEPSTTHSFTEVDIGAYYIYANDANSEYGVMIANTYDRANTPTGDGKPAPITANVVAKAEDHTLTKTSDDGFVGVGDTVSFEISGVFPTYTNANNDTLSSFVITDTSTGLAIDTDDVKVYWGTVDEGDALSSSDYSVQFVDSITADGAKDLIITFEASALIKANAGKHFTVAYDAVVTDADGYNNTVNADSTTVDYRPDTVIGYSGEITLEKKDSADQGGANLTDAEFQVYKLESGETWENNSAAIMERGAISFNLEETGVYSQVSSGGTTTVVATNGTLDLKGLGDGTYHIVETKAPDGYSINDKGLDVVISADSKHVTVDVDFLDTKLASLPSTGGIGTTIFTIGGCIIMIAAAGLFFASRRKSSK